MRAPSFFNPTGCPSTIRWVPWLAAMLLVVAAPWLLDSAFSLTLLTQIGYTIVVCLSFNLLLGQTGLLSFGHAVYVGLGAYAVIHLLRGMEAGGLGLPVPLLPLLAGVASAAVAALLGWPSTRHAGTAFAMITLGIGELVFALSHLLPSAFGGEAGLSANRTAGPAVLGWRFETDQQLYVLVMVYTLLCTAAMYGLGRTPLGLLFNAARDNPARIESLGYSAHRLRYTALVVAGFFAGIGGGLGALTFENVTPESLGSVQAAHILVFTVLGGTAHFWGPVLGAALMVLAQTWLGDLTQAWPLYVGLAFMAVVRAAPGGLAGLLVRMGRRDAPIWSPGTWRWAAPAGVAVLAAVVWIEMLYHRQLMAAMQPQLQVLGIPMDTAQWSHWAGVVVLGLSSAALAAWQWRRWVVGRQVAHGVVHEVAGGAGEPGGAEDRR
jgi:branched-chain amino acid transport system permease protein